MERTSRVVLLIGILLASFAFYAGGLVRAQGSTTQLRGIVGLEFIDPLPDSGIEPTTRPLLIRPEGTIRLDLDLATANVFVGREVVVTGSAIPRQLNRQVEQITFRVETLNVVDSQALDPPHTFRGNFPTLNLLCLQQGLTPPFTADRYPALFTTPGNGLIDYWEEVSYGAMTLDGSDTLAQWLDISRYPDNWQNSNVLVRQFWQECIDAADPFVDFSQFTGINFFDVENAGFSFARFGGEFLETDETGTRNFRVTYNSTPLALHQAGTVGHEMGHTFLMRHVGQPGGPYDTRRSIMGSGGRQCYQEQPGAPDNGCFPSQIDAFQLWQSDWIPDSRVTEVAVGQEVTIDLERLANPGSDGQLIALIPLQGSEDYYMVAARQGGITTDTTLPFSGVNIMFADLANGILSTSIDPPLLVQDEDGNGVLDDAGGIWTPGETFSDALLNISVTINSVAQDGSSYNVTIANQGIPQPPNDDVTGATPITLLTNGTLSFEENILTATSNPVTDQYSCTDTLPGFTVWYEFSASQDGIVTIDTLNSTFDTALALWTGNPNDLTEVACNDDANNTIQSIIEANVNSGETYFIMGGTFNAETVVDSPLFMDVRFEVAAPGNDEVSTASTVMLQDNDTIRVTQDISAATRNINTDNYACFGDPLNTVWYQVTPSTGGQLTLDTRAVNFDTVLAIYTGSPEALVEVACNDAFSVPDVLQAYLETPVNSGETYYIMVGTVSEITSDLILDLTFTPDTVDPTETATASLTTTATDEPSPTATASATHTATLGNLLTHTPTATITASPTATATDEPSPTATASATHTATLGNLPTNTPTLTPEQGPLDANGDGKISPADAIFVRNRLGATLAEAPSADTDEDGAITLDDFLLVLNTLAGDE